MVEIDIITVTYHGLTGHAIGTEFGFTAKSIDGRKYRYIGFNTLDEAMAKLKPPKTVMTLRATGKESLAAMVEVNGAVIGGVPFSPEEFKDND